MSNSTVGFIGLGRMGWPMAHNLATAGFPLVVHDVVADVAQRFAAEHGAVAATTAADFASTDVVVTMLPNGEIVQDSILRWTGGVASSLSAGSVIVEMSSSSPTDTVHLAEQVAEWGVRVVDAPVSGGVARAVSGELSLMVGGDPQDITRVLPVLDVLGDPARRFMSGPLGAGHAMKAMNNYVAAATYLATAEALVIGQRYGLSSTAGIEVINASTGRSFVSEVVFEEVVSGRYSTGFLLGLLAKDVRIARDLAAAADVDAPLSELVEHRWSEAVAALGGDRDHSEAHQAWWSAPLSAV